MFRVKRATSCNIPKSGVILQHFCNMVRGVAGAGSANSGSFRRLVGRVYGGGKSGGPLKVKGKGFRPCPLPCQATNWATNLKIAPNKRVTISRTDSHSLAAAGGLMGLSP